MRASISLLIVLLFATGTLSGCSRGNSAATKTPGPSSTASGEATAPGTPSSSDDDALSEVGEQTEPDVREPGADDAVRQALEGIRNNNPRVVWDFLPQGYQRDVNQLMHEFAGAADAELWRRSFRLAERASAVLKKKKSQIVTAREAQTGSKDVAAVAGKNLDAIAALLDAIVRSDLSDPEKLKTRDVGDLLGSTGVQLLNLLQALSSPYSGSEQATSLAAGLADVSVELVRADKTTAVIRLIPNKGQKADPADQFPELDFVRVEGKWIPRSLADGWQSEVKQWREQLHALAVASTAGAHPKATALIKTLEQDIDLLDSADKPQQCLDQLVKTFEHVRQFAAGQVETASADSTAAAHRAGPAPKLSDLDASVLVIVESQLDEIDLERVTAGLMAIVDSGDLAIVEPPVVGEKETHIHVFPVNDVALYAKRIGFADVTDVDANARTIRVRLKPGQPARE